MTTIRGSWTVHRGVVERWTDATLDDYIRGLDQWSSLSASEKARFPALSNEEARAKTPFPYVTYEVGDPRRLVGDSGKAASEHGIEWLYQVAFTVHARSKAVAQQVAAEIADNFEDVSLCVEPDEWIATEPSGDFSFREGDENWAWRLVYNVRVNANYAINRG